jgi:hypothetical protein
MAEVRAVLIRRKLLTVREQGERWLRASLYVWHQRRRDKADRASEQDQREQT